MFLKYFIILALCAAVCSISLPATGKKTLQDFSEHVLGIPNSKKILNTVLDRLERNRQQGFGARTSWLPQNTFPEEEDCEDPLVEGAEHLPEYTETLQNSREREMRQLGAQKHYPICHLERRIRKLNTNEYEYRPAYYEEVQCLSLQIEDETNEICSSLGFSCVQWNKTIHLTRRRYSSDCWETKTMVIPAGCECMWPVHRLGNILPHA